MIILSKIISAQMNRILIRNFITFCSICLMSKSACSGEDSFIHPGLLHNETDIQRMKEAVNNEKGTIYEGFKVLLESDYSKTDYKMRGPFPEWGRAPNIRTGEAQSDARAAYENALMWAVTGKKNHAKKSIQIINSWAGSLKKVTGIDGVLAAGIQGFKFVNAAEILRYTDSGWSEEDAKRCEKWFMNAWYPTIEHYAYFANGNWETAALQTNMAIAIYCSDRNLFESTVRYAVNGSGNGSINHLIVYPTGQCQETTRAQHYAQLGLGLLGGAAEIAWNQGVDLYGWNDNRILKGFEYTAKYGLGENVPYQHYLDRTGKYGLGGQHKHYTKISTVSRGNFYPIFEKIFNHYANRRNINIPYSAKVVELKRPEGPSGDYVGLGTLTHWRPPFRTSKPINAPGTPAGLVAQSTEEGIKVSWVRSVEPISFTNAQKYTLSRRNSSEEEFEIIDSKITKTHFHDKSAKKGTLYHYVVTATNEQGTSNRSAELAACSNLPGPWLSKDIGNVGIKGYSKFNGSRFSLEGEGNDIGGTSDEFHFAYAPMSGEGTITARIVRPMSSQWAKPGIMMRKTLDADSPHASVLLLPHWKGALVSRLSKGNPTQVSGITDLGDNHIIKKNRLSTPYWVRLIRFRNTFTGYLSSDGNNWNQISSIEIPMGSTFYVGLPACSQLNNVTTTVTYDSVSIPSWRTPNKEKIIMSRPEPRWHKKAWIERHQKFNERAKQGNVDLIMIGDSITHWWDTAGKEVWDKYYKKRNAVNLAISGDRTEHVLWRLENGNIEGISPKLATLMIGTNNHMSSSPEFTANDIRLIIKKLRSELPKTKILVLAIFPRGGNDDDTARQKNMRVNQLIANIGDSDMVHFLNINETFLNKRRLRNDLIPDGSHPNEKGYSAWAQALESKISKLMGEN
jgi:lysophospholipase L1-like esterase